MSDSVSNVNLVKEVFPVGKLLDIQLEVIGEDAGLALIGALNGHEGSKEIFFDNVSINRVGFHTYLSGPNAVSPMARDALALLGRYKRGEDHDLNTLEQFLISHMHNSVNRG
ncbi:hypothetical protein [Aeromonas phage phiWae15]|nr:hypothetical protein [Aeromonas phage phiWae15]